MTRAEPGATETAKRIEALGLRAVIAPMLEIEPLPAPELGDAAIQAVCFTSQNGVRTFAQAYRHRPQALCVGAATAEAAAAAGFDPIWSAEGDVDALATLALARLDPSFGRVVHAAGEARVGDLAGRLHSAGFQAQTVTLYAAHPAETFSERVREALVRGEIAAVLGHSKRGLARFVALYRNWRQAADLPRPAAICISPRVAEAADPAVFAQVRIAEHPDETALLARLSDGEPRQSDA
ncbi:MAG: uroporphyrinogen-III synthase [Maricaulaceae bacterium]